MLTNKYVRQVFVLADSHPLVQCEGEHDNGKGVDEALVPEIFPELRKDVVVGVQHGETKSLITCAWAFEFQDPGRPKRKRELRKPTANFVAVYSVQRYMRRTFES